MTSLKLCERAIPSSGLLLLGDTSTGKFRPVIPNSLQTTIFERMHNLSHPGIKATQKLIGERFVWPNMRRDIAEKYLHFLPTNKNYPTSSYTLTAFQNPKCQIFTCTRRYCRSSSQFFWLQIFTDSCRQIYALAGGHTHEGYYCAILCRFFSFTLGGPFWISYNNHYR